MELTLLIWENIFLKELFYIYKIFCHVLIYLKNLAIIIKFEYEFVVLLWYYYYNNKNL